MSAVQRDILQNMGSVWRDYGKDTLVRCFYGVFETVRETKDEQHFHSSALKLDEDNAKKSIHGAALGKTGL